MPRWNSTLLACLLAVTLAVPALAAEDPRDAPAECAPTAAVAETGQALPALDLPGDDLREDRVYPECSITKACPTGGSVSCSSPGGQFTCRYGWESCTTWDGCGGSKLYVDCGLDRNYCGCAKTQTNCPPEPSCPSGSACHFDSECGDGVCANRRCLCY